MAVSDSLDAPVVLTTDTPIYIAGHRGLVGSALWRHFAARGFGNLIGIGSDELDLRDAASVVDFFAETRPEIVIDAAARVGGILANASRPAEFIGDNLRIQNSLIDAALRTGTRRFLFLGSSCIYPKFAPQPIPEDALLGGPLEPTNEAYAIAKIAGITQIRAIRHQYGLPYISAMPTSLYGPGDNFDPDGGHVIPGMIRRFHDAVERDLDTVTCWGSGTPRREFLFIDDLADACHFLLSHYDGDVALNVGTGQDVTIAELAATVADVVGYTGEIRWDTGKPDGTPRKLLDVGRMRAMGWMARTPLRDGLAATYRGFLEGQI